jgi:hypothetical protein
MYSEHPSSFHIRDFLFTLVGAGHEAEWFIYHISFDALSLTFIVYGVNAREDNCPLSNVDIVFLLWESLERFPFAWHALTFSLQSMLMMIGPDCYV